MINNNNFYKNKLIKYLVWILPSFIKNVTAIQGVINIFVNNKNIIPSLLFFKKHTLFQSDVLIDIMAYDKLKSESRFLIIYSVLSLKYNIRVNIYSYVKEFSCLISIVSLFPSAIWSECEILDMFGIFFNHNHNLKRILTSYGFNGYPLRKDFPQSGYVEIRYNYDNKNLSYKALQLIQNFRSFKFKLKKNEKTK